MNLTFENRDFKQLEGDKADALFKMAIHNEIQKQESTEKKKELSVKHQVLCDETAMIGVLKQTEKATGELQETHIDFNREQSHT